MNQITTEINKINSKIDAIEQQLKKPFKAWTEGEKDEFGNHEQLRKNEMQLRKKEEQLRKKEEQLIELLILKEKEKQQPHSQESINKNLFEAGIAYLITAGSKKRKRIEWGEVSTIDQLSYDPNSILFKLDTDYLAETGLASDKLVLYCRPTFHEQFKFLRERVIENSVLGWILGPPGTGKSTTALAFASTLDRAEWTITWIHLSRSNFAVCVRLEGVSKKYCKIERINLDKISDILEEEEDSKQHIVFIDGYTLSGFRHQEVHMECYAWLEGSKNRRLVIVCSMPRRYKAKLEEDKMLNLEEFFVYSWKEQEYLEAVKNEDFFNNVKKVLDTDLSIDTSPNREDLVRSKLYYAGASARWMFLFPTKTIIQQTVHSVNSVSDIIPYIQRAVLDQSNNVVNRLFRLDLVGHGIFPRKTSIISRFAGVLLAIKSGPDLIRHLDAVTSHDRNPFMDGWMLELWFFASLRRGGVQLFDSNGEEFQTWPESNVHILYMNLFPTLSDTKGVWFKPNKWNQGGFEAIYLDKNKGLVRFVQVTCGDTHSFKLQYFRSFLDQLSKSSQSFQITSLEIIFIVDYNERTTFQLAKPSVPGLLSEFGWEFGKEEDRAQIVFIKR